MKETWETLDIKYEYRVELSPTVLKISSQWCALDGMTFRV